jgi:hypothetical protein
MDEPTIFIGSLPGENEVKLLVDGRTVAVFVAEQITHPQTGELVHHPWGGADRLLFALVNGRGGWTLSDDPVANENGVSFWIRPRTTNSENPIRFTLGVEIDGN